MEIETTQVGDSRMEVIRGKGNTSTRLTIAKERFTIKFQAGLTSEQEAWIIEFSKRVNTKLLPDLERTMRGGFYPHADGLLTRVSFRSHGRKKENPDYLWITAEEVGLEPLPMELTANQKAALERKNND